jgi:hypothetical protein
MLSILRNDLQLRHKTDDECKRWLKVLYDAENFGASDHTRSDILVKVASIGMPLQRELARVVLQATVCKAEETLKTFTL